MKIKTIQQKNKRKVLLIVSVLLVALIGAGVVAYFLTRPASLPAVQPASGPSEDTNVDTKPPTDDQKDAGDKIKEDSVKQDEDTGTDNTSVKVSMSALKNGTSAKVQTTIQRVSSKGKCTLVATMSGEKKTYTADVQALSSYSTCKGFTLTDLTSGTWQLTLQYVDGDHKGSASAKVTI